MAGCLLLSDGTIDESCDELGTCDGISDGGVVFVEEMDNRWAVSLLGGAGDLMDAWSGQGTDIGAVVYDETTGTAYLSVGESIRVLQSDGTPKISDVPLVTGGIPFPGGAVFAGDAGFVLVNGVEAEVLGGPNNLVTLFESANLANLKGSPLVAALVHFDIEIGTETPSILEFGGLQTNVAGFSPVAQSFDVSNNRAHDAFLMNGSYATCSNSGATYLVADLQEDDRDPDRYPSVDLGTIASCEYEAETDEVVLFSESNGIAWMDASGQVVRTIAGTEGYRIVNGSVW